MLGMLRDGAAPIISRGATKFSGGIYEFNVETSGRDRFWDGPLLPFSSAAAIDLAISAPSSVKQYLGGFPLLYTYPLSNNVFIEFHAV